MIVPILSVNLQERMSVITKCNTVQYYQGRYIDIILQ